MPFVEDGPVLFSTQDPAISASPLTRPIKGDTPMLKAHKIAALALILVMSACAAGMEGSERSGSSTLITQEELARVEANNLYEAVQRLRPRWLTVRSTRSMGLETEVVVVQGNTVIGGTSALRDFAVDAASSLRFMDGPTASASLTGLGGRHVAGAIVINTAR